MAAFHKSSVRAEKGVVIRASFDPFGACRFFLGEGHASLLWDVTDGSCFFFVVADCDLMFKPCVLGLCRKHDDSLQWRTPRDSTDGTVHGG